MPSVDHFELSFGGVTTLTNTNFGFSMQAKDLSGNNILRSGVNITVSLASGVGVLSGTLTRTTNRAGTATFDDLQYNTLEAITLAFSNDSLEAISNPANLSVNVSSIPGACITDDVNWTTTGGGCRDNGTSLIFSKISTAYYDWYQAIWGSEYSGNAAPDANDGAYTHDYDSATVLTGYKDSSLVNYCHSLVEGGFSDWRLPTRDQLTAAGIAGAWAHIGSVMATDNYWVSTSYNANNYQKYAVYLFDGSYGFQNGGSARKVICYRQ